MNEYAKQLHNATYTRLLTRASKDGENVNLETLKTLISQEIEEIARTKNTLMKELEGLERIQEHVMRRNSKQSLLFQKTAEQQDNELLAVKTKIQNTLSYIDANYELMGSLSDSYDEVDAEIKIQKIIEGNCL